MGGWVCVGRNLGCWVRQLVHELVGPIATNHNTKCIVDDIGFSAAVHPHHTFLEDRHSCRSGSRGKNTSYTDRHPVIAFARERLKQLAARATASRHRRLPLAPKLGFRVRSMTGKSHRIS